MLVADKVVLITGGSSGIGKQLAFDMAARGAKVAIASRDPEQVERAKAEFAAKGLSIRCFVCDITSLDQVRATIQSVETEFGGLDILVNNAGYAVYETFDESSMDEILKLVDVNLLGAIRCIKTALPGMLARKGGCIVNVASIAARLIITPNSSYCASKHGMVALSEALKYELAPYNIQINVICPGRVLTGFFDHPTFQKRAHRKETDYTVPIERVSRGIVSAIEKNRYMTYVPLTLGLLVWLMNTFSFVLKPIYGKLMSSRIRSIHATRSANNSNEAQISKDVR